MFSGKRLKDDSRPDGGKTTLDDLGNNHVQNSSHAKIVSSKISNGGEKKYNGRSTSGMIKNITQQFKMCVRDFHLKGLVKYIRDINI